MSGPPGSRGHGARRCSTQRRNRSPLHRVLAEATRNGITHAAMEASSHGLEQRRLDGVQLRAAGFTNFTQDHLDLS